MSKKVAVSGYFNPLHSGHLKLLRDAKALGDNLEVILNNDFQVHLKERFPFMNQDERKEVLEALEMVDGVTISYDKDFTVRETLSDVRPDIFANGGDRDIESIPEKEICDKYGIEMVQNVGGDKSQSSSSLIENVAENYWVRKPWGRYRNVVEGRDYRVKILEVSPQMRTSLQYHNFRDEYWQVLEGCLETQHGQKIDMETEWYYVPRQSPHQIINPSKDNVTRILEIWRGEFLSEDDIYRIKDPFTR